MGLELVADVYMSQQAVQHSHAAENTHKGGVSYGDHVGAYEFCSEMCVGHMV